MIPRAPAVTKRGLLGRRRKLSGARRDSGMEVAGFTWLCPSALHATACEPTLPEIDV
jgi:hypothetical protein